jgi:anthranilate phosphoribosyltransferase
VNEPNPILTRAIDRVAGGADLAGDEAAEVLREIMEGRASDPEAAAFLIALRTKGETVDEIVGLARTMRGLARPVRSTRPDLLDTAGTGGGALTFNVSTTAAFVAAGAGCAVAKHGNRSSTSRCGSADVLEALGARIDLEPPAIADCIDGLGFGFMFAPLHHPAMKYVVPVRRALAVRTIFNFLGPLTNPAGAARQVIGVSDATFVDPIAAALGRLGSKAALVVSSEDGLDEISVSAPTRVVELSDGRTGSYTVTPEELGVEPAPLGAVRAGTPADNAEITRAVLAGEPGPERSLTVLNAAAAIYAGGRAASLRDGVGAAERALDSGAARDVMERFVVRTGELAAS